MLARQTDAQIGQTERFRDTLAHKLAQVLAGDALDRLRDRPVVRVDMVEELFAGRIDRLPLREALETPLVIAPILE